MQTNTSTITPEAGEIIDRLVATPGWLVAVWRRTPFDCQAEVQGLCGEGEYAHISNVDALEGTLWDFEKAESTDSGVLLLCKDLFEPHYLGQDLKMTPDREEAATFLVRGFEPFRRMAGSLSLQLIDAKSGQVLGSTSNDTHLTLLSETDAADPNSNVAFEVSPLGVEE